MIERLRRNPKNVRSEEIDTLLLGLGFERRQAGTSHVVYSHGAYRVTVPQRRPFVKPVYVKLMLKVLDEVEGESAEGDL